MAEKQMARYGARRQVDKKLICRRLSKWLNHSEVTEGRLHPTRQVEGATKGRVEQLMEYKTVPVWCI